MKYFRRTLLFPLFLFLLSSCEEKLKRMESHETVVSEPLSAADSIRCTTFRDKNGWGYDVYVKGKRYIHQPHIPAKPGVRGFSSEENARKVAGWVMYKMQHNMNPPSVSAEEVDSLLSK